MPEGGRAGSGWRPERLRESKAFRRAFAEGRRYRGSVLRAAIVRNSLGALRLGFSVSAKKGKAVLRNRLRRRMRGLAHMYWPHGAVDIVVWPAVKLDRISLAQLKTEMARIGREIERVCGEGR